MRFCGENLCARAAARETHNSVVCSFACKPLFIVYRRGKESSAHRGGQQANSITFARQILEPGTLLSMSRVAERKAARTGGEILEAWGRLRNAVELPH